jgi:CubicO group peptidase (beta-lactamase class C family)
LRCKGETFQQATVAWPKDPQGYNLGGEGLKLPARDLAKLGYLYLTGGRWDRTQVVPPTTFVPPHSHKATQVRVTATATSGGSTTISYDTFRAQGYGGQLIYVIPKLDLVVVITSDPDQKRNDAGNLVWTTIVPAVTG